jgi:hypothetical protein
MQLHPVYSFCERLALTGKKGRGRLPRHQSVVSGQERAFHSLGRALFPCCEGMGSWRHLFRRCPALLRSANRQTGGRRRERAADLTEVALQRLFDDMTETPAVCDCCVLHSLHGVYRNAEGATDQGAAV